MDAKRQRALLATSVAGILAAMGAVGASSSVAAAEGESVHCYGINKCAGVGECGGKGHACAGKNACAGEGYIDLSEEKCLKVDGGRLTEEPEAVQE